MVTGYNGSMFNPSLQGKGGRRSRRETGDRDRLCGGMGASTVAPLLSEAEAMRVGERFIAPPTSMRSAPVALLF